ncbi:hypothetical protein GWI33_014037 [Rhynchophorus ferrugineus]|uniref:Ethylmalonyl-CoA decarboxylase n=1 Tax=Rhynchophorus ferrugineus TaxID=354439 RepID=A0A834I3G6_RHYFE|nr:hypothetical protein GWI33_014037 [Rhynchophorus ferrugineus]
MADNAEYSKDLDVIEEYMKQYGGGEVHLSNEYWNEGIAIITLDNPQKRNAISGKMMADFRKCVQRLQQWKNGKAVILQGANHNFCSGGDLDFVRTCHTEKDAYYFSYLMAETLDSFSRLPLISIALVHGPTLGGGAEIAVSCDYILVTSTTKLGFVHGKMGITTAWGGATRLCKKIGRKKAMDLFLTSKILNPHECVEIGLADDILDGEHHLKECLNWTRKRTQHHVSLIGAFKEATLLMEDDPEESMKRERELLLPLWGGPANKEALSRNIKHIPNKI